MTPDQGSGDGPREGPGADDGGLEAWLRFDDADDVSADEWQAIARVRAARLGSGRDPSVSSRIAQEAREASQARTQGIAAIGARIARATGLPVSIENTGGDVMVGTVTRRDGAVVAFTAEGVALYASQDGWDEGAETVRAESAAPWDVVVTAIAWTVGPV